MSNAMEGRSFVLNHQKHHWLMVLIIAMLALIFLYIQRGNLDFSLTPIHPHDRKLATYFVVDDWHTTAGQQNLLPPCSKEVFREYFRQEGAFPESGQWIKDNGYGYTDRFALDICKWEPFNLHQCLETKNIRHVLLIGDSTGWKLFVSFLNATLQMGGHCQFVRSEGRNSGKPNISYFSHGNAQLENAFTMKRRKCMRCRAQTYKCWLKTTNRIHSFKLEFIGSDKFKDLSLVISPEKAKAFNVLPANRFQEFLFQTYFKMTGYPDVLIMAMPLNHEKSNKDFLIDFQTLLDIIIQHRSTSMEVHWIPTASEFENKRSDPTYMNRTFFGLLATDRIYKENVNLYKVLEPFLLDPYSNMFGFINLVNMSKSKEAWNDDGVHYNDIWYSHVVRIFWSTYCQ